MKYPKNDISTRFYAPSYNPTPLYANSAIIPYFVPLRGQKP